MKRFHWFSALLAAILLSAIALRVEAQYQTDLQAPFDNNLQVGGGGINPRRPVIDYQLLNNIITGNVTGLGYFHDEIDYAAPLEFGDESSSDDLFRFRAQSLGPTPGGRLIRGRMLEPWPAGSVYSPYANPSRDKIRQGMVTRQGGDFLEAASEWSGYRVPKTFQMPGMDLPVRVYGVLQSQRLPDGRTAEVTASPLFGVRTQIYDPTKGLGLNELVPGTDADNAADDTPTPGVPGVPTAVDPTPPVITETEIPAATTDTDVYLPITTPTLDLGTYLQAQDLPLPADAAAEAIADANKQATLIEKHIFHPLDARTYQPGADPYLDLLNQIQAQQQIPTAEEPITPEPEPGSEVQPESLLNTYELLMPTQEQMEAARTEREQALQQRLNLPPAFSNEPFDPNRPFGALSDRVTQPPTEEAADQQAGEEEAEETEGAEEQEDESLLDVLQTLNYDLPRVGTFAGQMKTRLNEYLRQAEEDMQAGRYFDAEEIYRLVLIAQPGHPMARVGQMHSLIGAGMMESAGKSLRQILEDHPELIATRYDTKLMPAPQRLRWASGELQNMLRLSKASEPAILLAYLGYQLDQKPLIEYGLNLAQTRNPLDPLHPVLRRIWLDENPRLQATPQSAPVEPGTEPSPTPE